jgi:hypothetical protein
MTIELDHSIGPRVRPSVYTLEFPNRCLLPAGNTLNESTFSDSSEGTVGSRCPLTNRGTITIEVFVYIESKKLFAQKVDPYSASRSSSKSGAYATADDIEIAN